MFLAGPSESHCQTQTTWPQSLNNSGSLLIGCAYLFLSKKKKKLTMRLRVNVLLILGYPPGVLFSKFLLPASQEWASDTLARLFYLCCCRSGVAVACTPSSIGWPPLYNTLPACSQGLPSVHWTPTCHVLSLAFILALLLEYCCPTLSPGWCLLDYQDLTFNLLKVS